MKNSSLLAKALLESGPLRVGGVTYFLHGDRISACPSKRGSYKKRSDKVMESSNRFGEVRKFWSVYRQAVDELPVWQVIARETGRLRGDLLFHSVNGGYIDPGKGVSEFERFKFAVGVLDEPKVMEVERNGWNISVKWENGREWAKAGRDDVAYLGYFYGSQPRAPRMLSLVDVCREDGCLQVSIPDGGEPEQTELHLYLFFGDRKSERFSSSVYIHA